MRPGVSDERLHEVVSLVGLENRIQEPVKKYSLGMRQRLGVAQALLHNPKLLILDEMYRRVFFIQEEKFRMQLKEKHGAEYTI